MPIRSVVKVVHGDGRDMPLVTVRGVGMPAVLLRPGETLVFGRAPGAALDPGRVAIALPDCASHVSRLVGELVVGAETVTLNWLGAGEGQLSSLFDAPGGARRVIMTRSMSALLDDGENQLAVLLGRQDATGLTDMLITVDVQPSRPDGTDGLAPPVAQAPRPQDHACPEEAASGSSPWR
ncbi:hypothetical protein GCM10029964_081450 [Kibdelosporangium lantanae]